MKNAGANLIIRNNSAYVLTAELGNPASRSIVNQATQYLWDITSESYTAASYISIQVKGSSSQEFQTYFAQLPSSTPQGVVQALNSMGVGSFATLTQSAIATVVTYNDQLVYGILNIFNPGNPTLSTFIDLPDADPGGFMLVSQNFASIYIGSTQVDNFSNQQSIAAGDTVIVLFNLSPSNQLVKYVKTIQSLVAPFTITSEIQIIPAGTMFNDTFNADENVSYSLNLINP